MHIFGLTGGIACGKSTVAKVFEANGVRVLDADHVSRLVMEPGGAVYDETVKLFGKECLNEDGTLNRTYIGARIFGRDVETVSLREQYETFVHAGIRLCSGTIFDKFREQGCELACYDAALLIEKGLANHFRPLVVVTCEPNTQIARLMARNNLTEREARARIASQMPLADKVKVADLVIRNDRSQALLEEEAVRVLREVRHRLGIIKHSLNGSTCDVCGEPECTLYRIAEFVQHQVEKPSTGA